MRNLRRPRGATALAGVTVLTLGVLTGPAVTGPALAVPPITPGQAFLSSATDATFPFTVNRAGWSVAATQGLDGGQSDLEMRVPGSPTIARSGDGFGIVDWVAVNTNAGQQPVGSFAVRVTADTDGGRPTTHLVQLVQGGTRLAFGGVDTVGSAGQPWLVDVRDLELRAGDMISLQVGSDVGMVTVLQDDLKPIFARQTRHTAVLSVESPKPDTDDETFTVDFTAPADGDYGIVFEARNGFSRAASVSTSLVG